jgi:hypothetical protein
MDSSQILDREGWLEKLQKEPGLETVKLPSGIEFGGTVGEAVLTLTEKGIAANMQNDDAAFEGWAMALLVHGGANHIRVDLRNRQHVERFLYRLGRFDELLSVDANRYAKSARAINGADATNGRLFLNQPGPRFIEDGERRMRSEGISKDILRGSEDKLWSEGKLEKALEVSPSLKKTFATGNSGSMRIMRQWPVGLFEGKVAEANALFPYGRSAIDLIGIDDATLLLFEIKKSGNSKVGALSETFFYACVMRDALLGRFKFEEKEQPKGNEVTTDQILLCKKIRAVILAPDLHPLVHNPRGSNGGNIFARLNEAAELKWHDKPVQFEIWTLGVDESTIPADFTFSPVAA